MNTTTNFLIRGMDVQTASTRKLDAKRYLAVAIRPEPYQGERGTYVAYASVVKRTDSLAAANRAAATYEPGPGATTVVIDRVTGAEVN